MTAAARRVVLATRNRGKLEELRALAGGAGPGFVTADEAGFAGEVEEDGETFVANARKKALAVAAATGLVALADDSGLEVDALGGAPGVRSARYAGEPSDPAANNARLLVALAGVAPPRTARFRSVLVLARPGEVLAVEEGVLEGEIALAPRGTHGFGYDPLFVVPGLGRTLAELPPGEKNRISHRALALARMARHLAAL